MAQVIQVRQQGNAFRNCYPLTEAVRARAEATCLSPEVAEEMSWTGALTERQSHPPPATHWRHRCTEEVEYIYCHAGL